eukprot:897160-Prymnesium_polylepis.1
MHNIKNELAMRGYGITRSSKLIGIDIKGTTARARYENAVGEEKTFQLGNHLSREIWTSKQ